MRIEEYLGSLPGRAMSGEDARLPEASLREIFRLAEIGPGDVVYHLGCGDESGIVMAVEEFGARRAVGIDSDPGKIRDAASRVTDPRTELRCGRAEEADLSGATAVLFWFADEEVVGRMLGRFEGLAEGTRILTVWGPLPGCLPDRASFPYVVSTVPFRRAAGVREQLLAVLGVECVDFVTAWENAERYTRAVADPGVRNDRFLTIIQTLMIWINARNMGVACGEDVPEPVRTYIGIMREHFGIEFGHLLK